jgi:hypothetical protein
MPKHTKKELRLRKARNIAASLAADTTTVPKLGNKLSADVRLRAEGIVARLPRTRKNAVRLRKLIHR